jgi:transposase
VTLITLRPYSPELNPIEYLWHHLRSHHGSNRHYKDVDALYDAAENGWRKCCLDAATVKSVCGAPLRQ